MNNLKKTGIMGLLGLILVACGVKQKEEVKVDKEKMQMATDSVLYSVIVEREGEVARFSYAEFAKDLKGLEEYVDKGFLSKVQATHIVRYASERIETIKDAVDVCNSKFVAGAWYRVADWAEKQSEYLGVVYEALFDCKAAGIIAVTERLSTSRQPIVVLEAVKRAETEQTLLNAIENMEKRTVCAGATYDEMFKSKAKTPLVLRLLSKSKWSFVVVEAMKDPMTEDNDICDALEWARGSKNPEFRQMVYSVVKKRPNLSAKVAMRLANITGDVRILQNVSLGKDSVKVEENIK